MSSSSLFNQNFNFDQYSPQVLLLSKLSWFFSNKQSCCSPSASYINSIKKLLNNTQISLCNSDAALYYLYKLTVSKRTSFKTLLKKIKACNGGNGNVNGNFPQSMEQASSMTVPSNKSCHSNLYLQVVTTLMLSNKFLNDSSYTLKTWSDLSYVDQKILWKHELKILNKFKFKLNISTNEWKNWESFLKLSCKEFGINCDELFRYNDEKIKEKSKLISEIPKQQSEAHFLLTPCSPKTVLINKSGKRSRSEYQDTTTTTNNFYNQEPLFNNDSNKKLKTTTASTASSSTISGSSLSSNNYFSSPFSLPYFSQDMGQSTDINSTLSDKQYYQQQLSLLRYYSSLQQQQQPQQPQQQQQQYPEPYCSFQDQQYQQQQHHQQRFTSNCRMVVPPLKTQYNPIEMMNSVYNPNSLNFLASPSLLSPEHTIIYPEQQQLGFNYSTTTTYSGNYYNQ